MITTQVDTSALAEEIAQKLMLYMPLNLASAESPISISTEPYAKLRARLTELGYDHAYFARSLREKYKVDISTPTMSGRMTGKRPWLITEMYAAMDLLKLPHDKLHEYFPKNGFAGKVVERRNKK